MSSNDLSHMYKGTPITSTQHLPASRLRSRHKLIPFVVGISGLALLAIARAGSGWSVFQSSTTPISQNVSSATIQISLSGSGSSGSLSIGAQNLVAGDTIQREVIVTNTGTGSIGSITLSIAGPSQPNALVTDATNGLQAEMQTCSSGNWNATQLPDGGYSYTCSGNVNTIVAPGPISSFTSGVALPGSIGKLAPGSSIPLLVTLTLPTSAPNSMQGLSTSLTYTFVATQAIGGAS